MNRVDRKFASLREGNQKALTLFLTAGFPAIGSTVGLVQALERGGADMIEIGMPFSDPLADGPVIQQSSMIALSNGVHLTTILEYVREIRRRSDIPIILMGYINPILSFGAERYFTTASRAGVDGFILPEVPLEESSGFRDVLRSRGLADVLLVTPTSSPSRIARIDAASSGFLYCVSTTGVTGLRMHRTGDGYIRRIKRYARQNPVQVGFGIATPKDAQGFARYADGIVIGSALIKEIMRGTSGPKLSQWVRSFKRAISFTSRQKSIGP